MGKTKKTHFNPAFWIAHWSPEYMRSQRPKARECEVYALYRRTGTIARTKVENVHFENGLGLAILPVDAAKMVVDREGLSEAEITDMLAEIEEAGDLTMDFESTFNSMEASAPFEYLKRVIATKRIGLWEEKAHIATFLALQHLRHPKQWNALIQWRERVMGEPRWDSIARLRHPRTWRELAGPFASRLAGSRWNVHVSEEPSFPIGDRTIVVNDKKNRIWTPLSPLILLEICLDRAGDLPDISVDVQVIRKSTLANYLKLLAAQSDSIIVFSSADLLRDIARSFAFQSQPDLVAQVDGGDIWRVLFPIQLDPTNFHQPDG